MGWYLRPPFQLKSRLPALQHLNSLFLTEKSTSIQILKALVKSKKAPFITCCHIGISYRFKFQFKKSGQNFFCPKRPKMTIFGSLAFLGAFNLTDWFFSKKLMSIQIMNAQEVQKRELLGSQFVFGCFMVSTEQGALSTGQGAKNWLPSTPSFQFIRGQ